MSQMTRRHFGKILFGTAAAATMPQLGCNNVNRFPNLFEAMRTQEFVDQDGKPVDVDELRKKAMRSGGYVTASFGFNECTNYCMTVNKELKRLARDSRINHIVFNVRPEEDGMTQGERDKYLAELQGQMYGLKNVTVLYPAKNGKVLPDGHPIAEFSIKLGNITNPLDPKLHSPIISLYRADGSFVDRANGMEPTDVDRLEQNLKAQIQRGQ